MRQVGGGGRVDGPAGGVVVGGGQVGLRLLRGGVVRVGRAGRQDEPGGKPVIAGPGQSPRLPSSTLAPVLVTVDPPSTA